MNFFAMFRSAIKAHWVFSLVITVSALTAWLLVANGHHGLEAAAYKFAVVIIGGLARRRRYWLRQSVRAFPTMFLMARDGDVPCCPCVGIH